MRSAVIIGSTVLVALVLVGTWALSSRPPADERGPVEYADDRASIEAAIELDRLGILTAENFVGNRIRVIEGTFRNVGLRTVRSVELRLTFFDTEGGVVHEDEGEALRSPLPPGETRRYEFRYEGLPPSWNYRIPDVAVERVGF